MKKFLVAMLALLFFVPVNAQYLLEDNPKKEKKKKEVVESYNYDSESSSKTGYRGFADFGYGFCINNSDGYFNKITLSTTHGYQIIEDYLFLGGGLGFWSLYNDEAFSLPIFADVRSEFLTFEKWKLFADLKIGYVALSHSGFFMDPQIGVRYSLNDKLGLNLGVGTSAVNDCEATENVVCFSVKIGIDF